MPSDLSTLDLATLSAAESAIVAILRSKTCQWEQDSADAAATGDLSTALPMKHWADAADLLTLTVITEFSGFFGEVVRARFGVPTTAATSTRSVQDQILDALAVEVASAQEEPVAA
jgi:hypothetical protein